jgi:hypothetical protein
MNDKYFAIRLAHEFRLLARASDDAERWVRLRACFLLSSLMQRRFAIARLPRGPARR